MQLKISPEAADDLQRLFDFVLDRELSSSTPNLDLAAQAIEAISSALRTLPLNPFLGRKIRSPFERELVISFGRTGYVAIYKIADEEIIIGAVRHQRENDYN